MWLEERKTIDASKWKGNRREKGEDFFETPTQAILPILKYIPKEVKIIWECTAGGGAISNVLKNAGYTVIQTDINTSRQIEGEVKELDFLQDTPNFNFDAIIFNPPFSYKTEFMEKAISYGKFFMFICPITIMETKTRWKMFKQNKISILNLSNRIAYHGQNGKKPFFHSIWVVNDFKSTIHYEDLENYVKSNEQKTIDDFRSKKEKEEDIK